MFFFVCVRARLTRLFLSHPAGPREYNDVIQEERWMRSDSIWDRRSAEVQAHKVIIVGCMGFLWSNWPRTGQIVWLLLFDHTMSFEYDYYVWTQASKSSWEQYLPQMSANKTNQTTYFALQVTSTSTSLWEPGYNSTTCWCMFMKFFESALSWHQRCLY